ncbi:MAG TPA: hypothetical protein VNT76_02565, partial [Candidatus Binatus sp.]|nr:hypothetical protein [Candidatus Binatus sp.]
MAEENHMAENRRGKENRFYFSRGQMVLLGGAFVLASLIIFGLGIIIGKSIEERKIAKAEEPLVKIPVKPETSGAGGAQTPKKDEITFNNDSPSKAPPAPVAEEKTKEAAPEKIVKVEPPVPKLEKK